MPAAWLYSELSWSGLKSFCLYMSHMCIVAVTTALDLPIKTHSAQHCAVQQYTADMLASCPFKGSVSIATLDPCDLLSTCIPGLQRGLQPVLYNSAGTLLR
jgi:hypothetical protein